MEYRSLIKRTLSRNILSRIKLISFMEQDAGKQRPSVIKS